MLFHVIFCIRITLVSQSLKVFLPLTFSEKFWMSGICFINLCQSLQAKPSGPRVFFLKYLKDKFNYLNRLSTFGKLGFWLHESLLLTMWMLVVCLWRSLSVSPIHCHRVSFFIILSGSSYCSDVFSFIPHVGKCVFSFVFIGLSLLIFLIFPKIQVFFLLH